ncbi:AbrB/MazE/SpoVT family DNA-binding domain-containing protein [bacterium]|nr:AbrB/MazE/SpoVT family DNA-binding domain-containing protein [bacterium]
MNEAITKGIRMDSKRISITSKRQITIPQKFFSMLGFGSDAECVVRGNELIIRPIKEQSGGEFSEQILSELIAKGLTGDILLSEFKKAQKAVRPAVEEMITDAERIASDENNEASSYDDVFGSED